MPLNIQAFYNPATLLLALQSPEAAAQELANQGVVLGEEDALAIAATTQANDAGGAGGLGGVTNRQYEQQEAREQRAAERKQAAGQQGGGVFDALRNLFGGGRGEQAQQQVQTPPVPQLPGEQPPVPVTPQAGQPPLQLPGEQPPTLPIPLPQPNSAQSGDGLGVILQALSQATANNVQPPPPVAPRGGTYTDPNNLIPLLQLGSQQQPQVSALGDIIRNFYR